MIHYDEPSGSKVKPENPEETGSDCFKRGDEIWRRMEICSKIIQNLQNE